MMSLLIDCYPFLLQQLFTVFYGNSFVLFIFILGNKSTKSSGKKSVSDIPSRNHSKDFLDRKNSFDHQALASSLNEVVRKKKKREKEGRDFKKKRGKFDSGNVLEICCVYRREDIAVPQVRSYS